jgi:hypothetical protein
LVPVLGIAIGDYLLWNWSLNGSHDVLALVSGLTLPPLVVAGLWLLVLSVADLIAARVRRPSARARAGAGGAHARNRRRQRRRAATPASVESAQVASAQARGADSRKLAA